MLNNPQLENSYYKVISVIESCKTKEQQMDNDLHEAELSHTHQGMKALMNDFNNYQVATDRKIEELKKDLPSEIRKVIGHIEFSQNNLR